MKDKELTKENIEKYYNEENHSQFECAQYFNLSVWEFIGVLKKLGIKKDKKKHMEQIKKVKLEKAHKTYQEKTGYDNPRKNPEVQKKILETKIKNGVYDEQGTSGIERRLEKILIRKFGETNVVNHYRDKRYSRKTGYMFSCDFYIKSKDLFIELNAHPTHNNHPFNQILDSEEVERLLKSDKQWNKNLVETWVVRDTEKLNIANKNNLNYIVLYPTNTIHNNQKFNDQKYSNLIEYLLKKLNKNN